jgi:hypothetical protein
MHLYAASPRSDQPTSDEPTTTTAQSPTPDESTASPNPSTADAPGTPRESTGRDRSASPGESSAADATRSAGTGLRIRRRALVASVLLNGAAPLLVYMLLRSRLGDSGALACGAAIPVAWTLGVSVWRRRIDPIGVAGVCAYGIALLVLMVTGGNTLVLKLHEAIVTGPLGLACLVSVAVRRPLHLVVLRLMARTRPELREVARDPARRRTSAVITSLAGATLVVHFLALLALALSLPTGTYLAVSRPVGLAIIAVGALALVRYRGRLRRRHDA